LEIVGDSVLDINYGVAAISDVAKGTTMDNEVDSLSEEVGEGREGSDGTNYHVTATIEEDSMACSSVRESNFN
jgi:hypothetical protein